MCLITAVPKGKDKNIEDLKKFITKGMSTNTNGSGFMYKKDKTNIINIVKGYFKEEDIINDIATLDLQKEDELVIHHRTSTSGKVNEVNTHPFPITNNEKIAQLIVGQLKVPALCHNGIFQEYFKSGSDFNDTYHFTNDLIAVPEILSLIKRDHEKYMEIFKELMDFNKVAFLFPDKDMLLLGNFIEDNGYFHSNGGYKDYVYDAGGHNYSCSAAKRYPKHFVNSDNYTKDNGEDLFPKKDYQFPDLSKGKKNTLLLFNPEMIKITNKNYKDFLLVCKEDDNKGNFIKNKGYVFEEFIEDTVFNWVSSVDKEKTMQTLCWDNHKDNFRLYVKSTSREFYTGLYNLMVQVGKTPSPSMLKKIKRALERRKPDSYFKFKNYGHLRYNDLKYLYEYFTKKDDFKEIKETLGAGIGFTLNEDFIS